MDDDKAEIGRLAAEATNKMCRKMLEKRKAGIDKAMLRISQAMDAKKVSYFQKDGIVTDQRDDIDHSIRLTSAKMVTDIYDVMPAKKHEVKHDATGNMMSAVVKVLSDKGKNGRTGNK